MGKKGFLAKKKAKTFLKGSPGMPAYRENLVKICAGNLFVEHPQTLRLENLKSVPMATVVTGYPQKPNQP